MKGQIKVTIQAADRLKAITELAEAVKLTAKALSLPTQISITGCNIQAPDVAIKVALAEEVTETLIKEVE